MHINAEYSRLDFLVIFSLIVIILWQPAVAQSVSLPECTVDIEDNDDDGSLDNDGADGTIDIDKDGDGLIELCDLEGIDRIRYQLDGSGYKASADATTITQGCPATGCRGYELVKDLDFNTDTSYRTTSNKVTWTTGDGWVPIGSDSNRFSGVFEGNRHTIAHLYINRSSGEDIGLFAVTDDTVQINNIKLSDVNVTGDDDTGSLVGENYGSIIGIDVIGTVNGNFGTGGLVGDNNGQITLCVANVIVTGTARIGGLVGTNFGVISESRASGNVIGNVISGGLVGVNEGGIANTYATGNVSGNTQAGGLVGRIGFGGSITNSYAIGQVSGASSIGGLVGAGIGNSVVTASYWDTVASMQASRDSDAEFAKTTTELQSPIAPGTTSTAIYYGWSEDIWYFGSTNTYPLLRSTIDSDGDLVDDAIDIDDDNDGLIEVRNIDDLHEIRFQIDGSAKKRHANDQKNTIGCPSWGCMGYELVRSLDFNRVIDYRYGSINTDWTVADYSDDSDHGWHPLPGLRAVFNGNGYIIRNLQINRVDHNNAGLFGAVHRLGRVENVELVYPNIRGGSNVGGLVGNNNGVISDSYVRDYDTDASTRDTTKYIEAISGSVGGLVGRNDGGGANIGYIINSGAEINVQIKQNTSDDGINANAGGLAGFNINGAEIRNSYARGNVKGPCGVGGLTANNFSSNNAYPDENSKIINSYASGTLTTGFGNCNVDGNIRSGGLAAVNSGLISNSYTTSCWASGTNSVASGRRGGVVQNNSGTISNSYYQTTDCDGLQQTPSGSAKTQSELQTETTNSGIYQAWSLADWDFGDSSHYPALRYERGRGLAAVFFLVDGGNEEVTIEVAAPFSPLVFEYDVTILNPDINAVQIKPFVINDNATITITKQSDDPAPNYFANKANDELSAPISLDNQTTLTIVITDIIGDRTDNTTYTFAITRVMPLVIAEISVNPSGVIDEGSTMTITFTVSGGLGEYEYAYELDGEPLPSPSQPLLQFTIPTNIVARDRATQTVEVNIIVSDGIQIIEHPLVLTIRRVGNVSISSEVNASRLSVIFAVTDADGDGVVSYQWQQLELGDEWRDIAAATTPTYWLPADTDGSIRYRVNVSHTDGQGYMTNYQQGPFRAGDLDNDDDGLIEIYYLEDVNEMRYQLDGSGYRVSADTDKITSGCPDNGCIGYELVRSLDFADADSYGSGTTNTAWTTAAGWQPIDSDTDRFSGIFEGNGFTISGLYINRLAQDLIGLFAVLGSGSEIKNVGLLDINVQGDDHVSGLVGENNGSITNSYATGTVTGNIHIGGLVGRNNGSIINSHANVAVTATGSHIGGLVSRNNGSITNSYATGTVTGDNNIGGLVGFNNNRIINSYATGTVEGNSVIGGLVGESDGSIINSYATGMVTGHASIGGLVGESDGSIINSYATGTVTGDNNIGGLVGFNNNRITNSYASGAVSGNTVVGGLVGIHLGHLSNAYATGDVSLTSTSDNSLGGLVGQWIGQLLNQSSIRNSYAIGRVIPGVDNALNAGGLVGTEIGTTAGTANYWDVNKSDWVISAGDGVTPRTTMELQSPIVPGMTSTEIYYGWSIRDWDFGNSQHYPALHYASGPDEDACNADVTTPSNLPQCGILLPGQHGRDRGLAAVFFLADGGNEEVTIGVAAPFSPLVFEYDLTILNPDINAVQIKPFVINDNATIAITKQSDAFAFNYFANKANDELSAPISLDNQTTLTIVITDIIDDRTDNTTYTFAITRVMPLVIAEISVNPSGVIDEGSTMTITFTVSGGMGEYEYTYELDGEPLLSPSQPLLQFTIPTNIVARDRATQTVEVNIIVSDGIQIIEHPLVLTIRRVGNVSISSEVNASRLSVIFAVTDADGDGVVSYQWQQLELAGEWTDIAEATTPTYWLPADTDGSIRYRVNVSHTDGQGYMTNYQQGPFRAGDLDNDDDGLIEIYYLEDVNAMRYQLAGRGYQASTDAAVSMLGCPVSGCNGYELRRDLDFNNDADYSVISNREVWTTGTSWQPIGDVDDPFSAIFEGNGFTISGLYINRPAQDRIGLFAVLGSGSEIKNFGLLDVNVQGDYNVGSLVGENNGSIINSYANVTVTAAGYNIGSLVGRNNESIINSYATGTVDGDSEVGGLVGENRGSITNSYASGTVSGDRRVGGLVGRNDNRIINSYASGTVSGDRRVGGLVGRNDNRIINSYATGAVSGSYRVGGLSGWNEGSIINSYASGVVSGHQVIGGLVGVNDGDIISSFAYADVIGITEDMGGLVGLNYRGNIINTYAAGTVSSTQTVAAVGGLIGVSSSGSIRNSYAISRVMPLTGSSRVGGLVGSNAHATITTSYWDKTVNAGLTTSSGAKTTAELITPTAPGATSADTYYGWSTAAWDFGDRIHYPTLYYANATTDSITVSVCADNPTPSSVLPRCGSLIPNQAIRDLITALEVSEITISSHPPANDDGTIDEGSDVTLSFDVTGGTGNYEYVYLIDDTPLLRSNTQPFVYKIAEDFLSADVSTQNVTFKVIAHDGALITSRSEVLTIRKINNGSLDIALDVSPARLSIRSVRADPDGEGTFTYIWQKLDITDTIWITIGDATTATYNLPEGASGSIRYRVDVKYVDGQGYGIDYAKGAQQKSFILMPLRADIDIDDDGLIEIYYLEDLDAIRYQLDGTAYKANADAAAITTGCPDRGGGEVCNGYELARSLDFNNLSHYEAMEINSAWTTATTGWMPIANNSVRFDSVFEGNGFTISGLYIARQFEENLGLFSVLGSNSVVKNFGLLDVSIVGADHIGGLVGQNFGTIINSYVATANIGGDIAFDAGGLVGFNDGTIINSYVATATVVSRADTGGLVSSNSGNIISSFAYADVIGLSRLGGLVGVNTGNIINTYAAGTVASIQTVIQAGGLVGSHSLLGSIRNSYAVSRVMPLTDGSSQVGGLVGNALSSITASYWDKTVNADLATSDDAKTTAELRNPTAPGATSADTYYGWHTAAWDFGDRIHYPTLYYATTDSITVSACAANPASSSALPRCGSRIPNQAVRNLISVLEVSEVTTSSQPVANNDGTINEGSNVNLMVNATGGSGVYNFAWSQTSGRTLELEGSTSATLSFTIPIDFVELDATTAAITFQVEVSDGFTTASRSKVVTIVKIDNGSPAIKTDADASRLSVSLATPDPDGEGGFSLQWQSQVPEGEWEDITGATTATYWLPADADDADDSRIRYRAVDIIYTDGQGYETKYGNQGPFLSAIELTGEIGGEARADEGETLVLTAPTVSGGSEVYSYEWTYSAEDSMHLSGKSELAVTGTDAATLNVVIPTDFIALDPESTTFTFKVIVNDGFTTVERSTEVTIVKINNSSIPAIKTDADASRLRVSLVEPDADGEGDFSLQWQSQVPEGEWTDITNATMATYSLPARADDSRIRYRAINISYIDGQGYVTEYDDQGPFPGAIEATGDISGDARVNEGEVLVLTAPTVRGGSGVYSYEWIQIASKIFITTLNIAIPANFIALEATSANITFKVIVDDGFTTTSRSKVVTIDKIDNGSPAIKTNTDASRLSVSLAASDPDGEGGFSLQWQSQVPEGEWTDITDATTATYWLPASAKDSRIRYRAIDISYTDGQGYVKTYDNQGPFPGAIEATSEIGGGDTQTNEGEILVLTAPTVSGGSEVYSYAWTYSAEDSAHLSGNSELAVTGTTATTLNVTIPVDFIASTATTSKFTFKVIVNDGFTTTSRSKVVTIAKIDNGSSAIKTDADASRLSVSLVEPDVDGEGDFSLQWQSQVPEEEWMNITGATMATYWLPADRNQRIRYRAIDISYTDGQGYVKTYDNQGLFLGAIEAIDEIGGEARADEGETLVLTAPTVSGGSEVYSYEWTYSAEDSMHLSGKSELAVTGTDAATLNVVIPTDFIALDPESTTFTFKVIVNDGFTTVERSTEVTIVKINNSSSPAIKTDADSSRLRVSLVEPDADGEGDFSLQWQSQVPEEEWMNITGATTATYWLPASAKDSIIRYRAISISYTDGQGYVKTYDDQGPFPGAIEATDEIGGDEQTDEGETLVLTASTVRGGSEVYSYEWTYSAEDSTHLSGKSELAVTGTDAATLDVTIPVDFIASATTSTKFTFKVVVNDGFTTTTQSKVVTIIKIDNGVPAIDYVETTKTLTVIVGSDPDGETSTTYHWEQRILPEENWTTITSAITATYQLPEVPDGSILYRVNVSHTDGQGYVTTATGGPFRPSAVAGLIALDISTSAILVPKFTADIFTYVLKIAADANELSLTPFASTGSIVYSVNGGAEQAVARGQPFTVPLTEESQTLTITVELQDGSFKSAVYTISKIERVIFTNIRLFLEGLLP